MYKNTINILIIIITLCSGVLFTSQSANAQNTWDWGTETVPQEPKKKKKEKRKKKGTVLKNTDNAFESYGVEQDISVPEPDTDYTFEDEDTKTKKEREQRAKTRVKSGKKSKGESITVDLGILYNVALDTVEVKDKRRVMDFKTGEDLKVYYNQALLKLKGKQYDLALEYLDKCIESDPFNKEFLHLRGNVLIELFKFKKALKDFDKALAIDNADPVVHYNRGIALGKLGKYEHAQVAFSQAMNLDEAYTYAIQGRASTKIMNGDYKGAIEDFNHVLDQHSFYTPAIKGRGIAKSLLRRYDDAISDFSYVIELSPNDGLAYYYRGLAYYSNNQDNRGCRDLDKAYSLNVQQAYYDIEELCKKKRR